MTSDRSPKEKNLTPIDSRGSQEAREKTSRRISFGQILRATGARPLFPEEGSAETAITGIAYDSREVRPGDLFVAIPGTRQDGAQYISDAVARGASAVLAETGLFKATTAPIGVVKSARLSLAQAAAEFHGHPSRKLKVIGVTGTDGKTTTSFLTAGVLRELGYHVGLISTVGVRMDEEVWEETTKHTTPQAPELQAMLARMAEAGAEYVIVEVSSHSIALERVAEIAFDVGVFTNLTPEHLDFHGTFEEYRYQKTRLFMRLGQIARKSARTAAIINADDPSAVDFAAVAMAPVVSYGLGERGDIRARDLRLSPSGSAFSIESKLLPPSASDEAPWGLGDRLWLRTPLVGRFNVQNWLAAIGVGLSQGADTESIRRAVEKVQPVPGRLHRVDVGQPFAVVVDFAHTPNGLAQTLSTLRELTPGKLIVVFGHAGGRDALNRPILGETAGKLANITILTTDDPYEEDPRAIMREIMPGLFASKCVEGRDFFRIVDRRDAFGFAFDLAQPGDTVLLAGRGHERTMVIGEEEVEFDDSAVAADLLRRMIGQRQIAA